MIMTSLLLLIPAEAVNSIQSFIEESPRKGQHQPHVSRVVEAFSRQALDALLRDEALNELEVGELWEPVHVDLDHHVHGAAGHDGDQTRAVPQLGEGKVRIVLDHVDRIFKE